MASIDISGLSIIHYYFAMPTKYSDRENPIQKWWTDRKTGAFSRPELTIQEYDIWKFHWVHRLQESSLNGL